MSQRLHGGSWARSVRRLTTCVRCWTALNALTRTPPPDQSGLLQSPRSACPSLRPASCAVAQDGEREDAEAGPGGQPALAARAGPAVAKAGQQQRQTACPLLPASLVDRQVEQAVLSLRRPAYSVLCFLPA